MDLIARFLLRTVFIYTLGKEYLGLSGLFNNILSMLSLADLGIGVAITFSLYKPIEENDEDKIKILMRVFKKTYICIGAVVIIIGVALTPFLDFFIKDMPDIPYIRLIYVLYVANTAISYFYSYKTSYVIANQKSYVVTNNRYLMNLLCAIAQSIALFAFENYILFLVIQIAFTIIQNVRISYKADKMYPVLKEHTEEKLDVETKDTIEKNVKSLIIQRVSSEIVFSTDNILLSKIFGLAIVGLYSNYTLVINALQFILSQFFSSITASIGNLGVSADEKHQEEIFYVIYFINFWLFSFTSIALGALFQPFIELWLGDDYLMSTGCLFFIELNYYLKGMRQTISAFNNAYGMMHYFKYIPALECVINIGTSILLGVLLGPIGIFIGTTISILAVPMWLEPMVLIKHGLKTSEVKFFGRISGYTIYTGIILIFMVWLLGRINVSGIIGFLIKLIVVGLVPNAIMCMIFFKTNEFKYLLNLALRIVKRK